MTCDERLEKLLNRAGQTIADLMPNKHALADLDTALIEVKKCYKDVTADGEISNTLYCLMYILHLTDVIDRLEWALDNVTRERDWLKEMNRLHAGCQTCAHHVDGDPLQCADGKRLCHLGDDGACVSWEYCGVPEDWRADDV